MKIAQAHDGVFANSPLGQSRTAGKTTIAAHIIQIIVAATKGETAATITVVTRQLGVLCSSLIQRLAAYIWSLRSEIRNPDIPLPVVKLSQYSGLLPLKSIGSDVTEMPRS
jgi:hypothetical protein